MSATETALPATVYGQEEFPPELSTEDKIQILLRCFGEGLLPPDDLMLDEWSDRHRVLPRVSSSEYGLWRTSRFPFLREIMRELSPCSSRQQIVVMKGAQLGFTEIAVNWMMYTIDQDPAPLLYVQKTIDAVEKFSKQRLQPSVNVCPAVQERIGGTETKGDKGNTITIKNFPGGIIILGGANSAASLRSMPIERLVLDEEDSYDNEIEDEGSPSDLAIRRTANFPRRKIFRLSTPLIKETSRIEPLYEEGDQRRYYVPCPLCGHMQVIWWRNIKYDKQDDGEPINIRMECEMCKQGIPERYKTQMLEEGEWIAEFPGREIASFHISSLYSPVGFFSWRDAIHMWIRANRERDKSLLKIFVNTVLGETWTESQKTIHVSSLMDRREDYHAEVPEGALVLSAGVDVQEGMVAIEVVAWGKGQESWSIEYTTIMGDTELSFVWEQLAQYLQKQWRHANGSTVGIAVTAVDSGHRARVVYNFCRHHEVMRVYPVKGRYGWGIGLIKRPKTRNQDGVYLFIAHVDELKSKIYSHLSVESAGPSFCHFPLTSGYNEDYFKGLTAERLITRRSHGQHTLQWDLPPGKRNEPLDCRAYAIASLNILNPNFDLLASTGPLQLQNRPVIAKSTKARVLSRGL